MIKYRSPSQKSHYLILALTLSIFVFTTFWSVLFVEYFDPGSYLWEQLDSASLPESTSAAEGVLAHFFYAVIFSAFVSVSGYFLQHYLFVKVSQGSLPEGFYTQNSWLDVDDKYLVLIQADELFFLSLKEKWPENCRLSINMMHQLMS